MTLLQAQQDYSNDLKQFDAIQTKYNLQSVFLVEGVKAADLEQKIGKVKTLTYKSYSRTQEVSFKWPRSMTWLELWIEADKLIMCSEQPHFKFIDVFEEDTLNPGHYHLYTIS